MFAMLKGFLDLLLSESGIRSLEEGLMELCGTSSVTSSTSSSVYSRWSLFGE